MRSQEVAADDWLIASTEARDAGFTFFDHLGCDDDIGRTDTLRVSLVLRDLDDPALGTLTLTTAVPRDGGTLASLRTVFAGAGWHEREAAELFGVTFAGGDPRRLLLAAGYEGTPLRKDEVLGARAAVGWPGAKEPGESDASPSRRRMVPPGVPDPAVWGDRDGETPAPTPDEVAASAVGGRVRRGRR